MNSRRRVATLCLLAALCGGCAGARSGPGLLPPTALLEAAKCRSTHGVKIVPCRVDLTLGSPKAHVTASGPKGGSFSYSDKKCMTEGIAQVERTSEKNHYLAVAGTIPGTCTATFTDRERSGKVIGTATLTIAFYKREHCPPTCQLPMLQLHAFQKVEPSGAGAMPRT
jgi:hypothetical protein